MDLPYQESGFAFTAIPPEEWRFTAIENELTSGALNHMIDAIISTRMVVYLPRFTFESSADLALTLQSMGMTNAFDPAESDSTGMLVRDTPHPLFLSDVLHKA